MGVGIFWFGLNRADLVCWRLTLNFDPFIMFTIRTSIIQLAEKDSFHHLVLNNLRSSPWTAVITCANFSPHT